MGIKANNCKELVNETVIAINNSLKEAKQNSCSLAQLETLNSSSLVMILGAIAHTLAVIADKLEEG